MIYFDTSYVVRLYVPDSGWEKVQALAATDHVASCLLGRTEAVAAFHRKFREGAIEQRDLDVLLRQFESDCRAGAFRWLPLSGAVVESVTRVYATLPRTVSLRAADAVHLGCARANGLNAVYSNDARLLVAATHFGLQAINII